MPETSDNDLMITRFKKLLAHDERPLEEINGLAKLMGLFAILPPPPDPFGFFSQYPELKQEFIQAAENGGTELLEETFLRLYSHVHGYEVPFTPAEQHRFRASEGYLCHVGGLSPILKAGPFVNPATVSGDFGAGNGLQGLLLQHLYPHCRTVQIEISSRMVEAGRLLQEWMGIPRDRVEWVVGDVSQVSPATMDFVYLYLPVRPSGEGRLFYERFAAELELADKHVIVFSIADCLKTFLSSRFEAFYNDGHLTCFRRRDRI